MVPVQEIGGASWEEVGAGHAFACATRTNGTLWCWGENAVGQVGINSVATPQMAPVQVGSATWKVLAVGGYHACGIQSDGTLWCWGANGSGQVATGSTSVSVNSPDQVGSLTTWMHVSAGLYHTCATRTDGTLWCWGSDDNSQTGTGGAQVNPVQVGVLTTWKSVTLGSRHSCATRTTRWVYCWGRNAEGQLGLGNAYDASPQPNPVHVSWLPPSFASLGVFSSSSANSTFFILPSS
jgi:alpha-tubulin suppressor-like RCC1 family protein